MKSATVAFVLTVVCALVQPSPSFAKGSHRHGGGQSAVQSLLKMSYAIFHWPFTRR
jgi:hypothetical protein